MSPLDSNQSAVIIGGGVGGLAAAIALREQGLQVQVFEHRTPRARGAGLVLWPNASPILDRLGVQLPAGPPLTRMRRRTDRGEPLCTIPLDRLYARMGATSRPTLHAELLEVLRARARAVGVALHLGSAAAAVTTRGDQAVAHIEGIGEIAADLLVGADGRMASVCRRYVMGANRPHYAGYVNWVGVLPPDTGLTLHPTTIEDFWGPGARFGVVPLPTGGAYWAACVRMDERAARRAPAQPPSLFARWPAPVPQVLQHTPPDRVRPIAVYDHAPARGWSRGRVVLLGDAAHAALPTSMVPPTTVPAAAPTRPPRTAAVIPVKPKSTSRTWIWSPSTAATSACPPAAIPAIPRCCAARSARPIRMAFS